MGSMERFTLSQFTAAVGSKIDTFAVNRLVAEQEDEAIAMRRVQTMAEWLAELAAWQEAMELGVLDGGGFERQDRRSGCERRTAPR